MEASSFLLEYSKTCVREPPSRLTLNSGWCGKSCLSYKGTCHVILLAKLHDMYLYKTTTFPHQSLKSISKVAVLHRFYCIHTFAKGRQNTFKSVTSPMNVCQLPTLGLHCLHKSIVNLLIVFGFNDTSALVGHFVSSPRERDKKDRRYSRGDEREGREGQRRRKCRNRRNKTSSSTLSCYKDSRPCPTVGGPRWRKIHDTFAPLDQPISLLKATIRNTWRIVFHVYKGKNFNF